MLRCIVDPETEIRLFELRHADEAYPVVDRNREHIRRYLSWPDRNKSVEDFRDFIRHALTSFARQEGIHCGLWHRGQFAGGIGATIDNVNLVATIGYWI